jgi:hypothetical protein
VPRTVKPIGVLILQRGGQALACDTEYELNFQVTEVHAVEHENVAKVLDESVGDLLGVRHGVDLSQNRKAESVAAPA